MQSRQLFEICQKPFINHEDFLQASDLLSFGTQINYKDPETQKTPAMVLIENKKHDVVLLNLILSQDYIDIGSIDLHGKNILHYLIVHNCQKYIGFFENKREVLRLLFSGNNESQLWDNYQHQIYFIQTLDKDGLIYTLPTEYRIVDRMLRKMITLDVALCAPEMLPYYECLDVFLQYDHFMQYDNILLHDHIMDILEGAMTHNAQITFHYCIEIIKKSSIMPPQSKNWLIKSLHADDKKNIMMKGIITVFGKKYFPCETKKGLNPAHILVTHHSMNGLHYIKRTYGDIFFHQADKQGRLPVHYARYEDIILFFYKENIDFNRVDVLGRTLLHYVFEESNLIEYKIFSFLMNTIKMNLVLKDKQGFSPFDLALHFNRSACMAEVLTDFCKHAKQEDIMYCVRAVQRYGALALLKKLYPFIEHEETKKNITLIMHHTNRKIIKKISKSMSWSSSVGDIDIERMQYAIVALRGKLGSEFYCDVVHEDEIYDWVNHIAKSLHHVQCRNLYFCITNDAHWVCGEIHIVDGCVKNILLMDPMIDQVPTDKVYEVFSSAFLQTPIYMSGVSKQGRDTFCPFYCLNDIKHLFHVRKFLPPSFHGDLYAYCDAHVLPMHYLKQNIIPELRSIDKVCDLPAYLKLTVRSLNGKVDSYRKNKLVFWVSALTEEEKKQFQLVKGRSIEETLEKNIHQGLNRRIEHKILKTRENAVGFFLSSSQCLPSKKLFKLTHQYSN